MQLARVVAFVADMDRAVAFYRDTLGLPLKFQTPEWSEFATGETAFVLCPATAAHPPGSLQAGFTVPDIHQFFGEAEARGVEFVQPPTAGEFGTVALIRDSEGGVLSVTRSGK